MQTLEERLLRVSRRDRNDLLGDDRPAVERLVHEMDGHARDANTGGKRVAHWMRAGKRRQQAGVDVQDVAAETLQRRRAEHAHEACEHDPVDLRLLQRVGDGVVPRVSVRMNCGVDERGRDAFVGRKAKRVTRPIGEHEPDLTAEQPAPLETTQRTKIRPGARDANSNAAAHAST